MDDRKGNSPEPLACCEISARLAARHTQAVTAAAPPPPLTLTTATLVTRPALNDDGRGSERDGEEEGEGGLHRHRRVRGARHGGGGPRMEDSVRDSGAVHPAGAAGQGRHRSGADGQRQDRRIRAAHPAGAPGQAPGVLRARALPDARARHPNQRAVRGAGRRHRRQDRRARGRHRHDGAVHPAG